MNRSSIVHADFKAYLHAVCLQVRPKAMHAEIREELAAHLVELAEENEADGMTEEEARKHAIARMGDPEGVGRELDYVHRPRTDWLLLLVIALLSAAGLLTMYSFLLESPLTQYGDYFSAKLLHVGIGAVILAVLWRFDYRKIKSWSPFVFISGLLLLLAAVNLNELKNGRLAYFSLGMFQFYVPAVAVLLLLVGNAGMKALRDCTWKETLLVIGYRGIAPFVLLLEMHVGSIAFVYAVIFAVYMWVTKRSQWQLIPGLVGGAVAVYLFLAKNPYYLHLERLLGFLNRSDDPQGFHYFQVRSLEMLRAAGWWGGELSQTYNAPYAAGEGVLTRFIYSYGWAAGIAVLLLIAVFVAKMILSAVGIRDSYGRLLFVGIGSWFILQFGWAVAMAFGFAPFAGISMPLVSYGGSSQIVHFVALGLLLGVTRRRNMVPRLVIE